MTTLFAVIHAINMWMLHSEISRIGKWLKLVFQGRISLKLVASRNTGIQLFTIERWETDISLKKEK